MSQGEGKTGKPGLPEGLRTAVEQTVAATTQGAATTAERAQALLDEVARRGQEAREEVARRGQQTREGLSRIRFASAEEVAALETRLAETEQRLREIETALKVLVVNPQSKAEG